MGQTVRIVKHSRHLKWGGDSGYSKCDKCNGTGRVKDEKKKSGKDGKKK